MKKRVGLHRKKETKNNLHTIVFFNALYNMKKKLKITQKMKKENQYVCYTYGELLRKHLVFKK